MAMINAKSVSKLLAQLVKMLGREPTLREFRRALNGFMPKKGEY